MLLLLFQFLQILHTLLSALRVATPTALPLVAMDDSTRFLKRERGWDLKYRWKDCRWIRGTDHVFNQKEEDKQDGHRCGKCEVW